MLVPSAFLTLFVVAFILTECVYGWCLKYVAGTSIRILARERRGIFRCVAFIIAAAYTIIVLFLGDMPLRFHFSVAGMFVVVALYAATDIITWTRPHRPVRAVPAKR